MSQDQPIDNGGFVLCTWDNGVVQQGMYLAKSATMDVSSSGDVHSVILNEVK